MSQTYLDPKACPSDAWRGWLRDAFIVVCRGAGTWWPVEILVNTFCAAACVHADIVSLVAMISLTVPLFGARTAIAKTLASGECALIAVFSAAAADLKTNASAYIAATAVRIAYASVLSVAVLALAWWPNWSPPYPATAPRGLLDGLNSWFYLWADTLMLQRAGPVSFLPWLRTRIGLDRRHADKLVSLAFGRNLRSLATSMLGLCTIILVLSAGPVWMSLFVLLVQPLWSAFMQRAWNDIFDGGAGLAERKKTSAAETDACPVPA